MVKDDFITSWTTNFEKKKKKKILHPLPSKNSRFCEKITKKLRFSNFRPKNPHLVQINTKQLVIRDFKQSNENYKTVIKIKIG